MTAHRPQVRDIQEAVAVGPRPPRLRLSMEWLVAAGVAAGMGSTLSIVHHYDQTHPQAQRRSDLPAIVEAVASTRPRLPR